MQICIVLPSGSLAHSTIHYTRNNPILMALSSNAANLLVRRCTRVYDLARIVLGMCCICRNYAVLGGLKWFTMVVLGNCRGLPDGTHVCGVHMYTSPRWIRVRTHVHASTCMHMRGFSFTVSDSLPIRRVSEHSTCDSKVQQVLLANGIHLCQYSVYASRCMPVLQGHAPLYCAVVRVRR